MKIMAVEKDVRQIDPENEQMIFSEESLHQPISSGSAQPWLEMGLSGNSIA
ncbi:MAG: hypothetical protein WCK34_01715 [Bacteroidota bacterium]